ncbi:MAG: hypothetical protein AB7E47_10065 [Desulfovibrionaceae bacterium]
MTRNAFGQQAGGIPATNIYGKDRDNIPPLQYQGTAGAMGKNGGCIACHGEEMDASAHHPIPEQK